MAASLGIKFPAPDDVTNRRNLPPNVPQGHRLKAGHRKRIRAATKKHLSDEFFARIEDEITDERLAEWDEVKIGSAKPADPAEFTVDVSPNTEKPDSAAEVLEKLRGRVDALLDALGWRDRADGAAPEARPLLTEDATDLLHDALARRGAGPGAIRELQEKLRWFWSAILSAEREAPARRGRGRPKGQSYDGILREIVVECLVWDYVDLAAQTYDEARELDFVTLAEFEAHCRPRLRLATPKVISSIIKETFRAVGIDRRDSGSLAKRALDLFREKAEQARKKAEQARKKAGRARKKAGRAMNSAR